jgi:hypothetical protein
MASSSLLLFLPNYVTSAKNNLRQVYNKIGIKTNL